MTGGLFHIDKWELNVIFTQTYRVLVKIDLIRYFGNEGEALLGDPRPFNTFKAIEEVLNDPKRKR
jgi:hypothetical protein